MNVRALKTKKVYPNDDLFNIIDESITELGENYIVVVTSKIVSLCEGRVVATNKATKEELIPLEADLYLPKEYSKYHHKFTITNNTLIASAGIDESNGGDYLVLWPKDSQESVNKIRQHLREKFKIKNLGVIITDSTSQPLRRGSYGICLAYSGFRSLNTYIGKPDLFGRLFEVSNSNIASGLSASAVVVMGEGAEQTPLAIINDVPFVHFVDEDPDDKELESVRIPLDEDLFAPLIQRAPWLKGQRKLK